MFLSSFMPSLFPSSVLQSLVVPNFTLQGVIATRVTSEGVCYISTMDRRVMPTFDALPRLAEQNRVRFQGSNCLGACTVLQRKLKAQVWLFA